MRKLERRIYLTLVKSAEAQVVRFERSAEEDFHLLALVALFDVHAQFGQREAALDVLAQMDKRRWREDSDIVADVALGLGVGLNDLESAREILRPSIATLAENMADFRERRRWFRLKCVQLRVETHANPDYPGAPHQIAEIVDTLSRFYTYDESLIEAMEVLSRKRTGGQAARKLLEAMWADAATQKRFHGGDAESAARVERVLRLYDEHSEGVSATRRRVAGIQVRCFRVVPRTGSTARNRTGAGTPRRSSTQSTTS